MWKAEKTSLQAKEGPRKEEGTPGSIGENLFPGVARKHMNGVKTPQDKRGGLESGKLHTKDHVGSAVESLHREGGTEWGTGKEPSLV